MFSKKYPALKIYGVRDISVNLWLIPKIDTEPPIILQE